MLILSAPALALAPPATAETTVTVQLTIDGDEVFPFSLPPYDEAPVATSCDVTVPDGASGGAVLDRAVEVDCLSSWDFRKDPDFGRFVTGINGTHGHCGAEDQPPGLWPVFCSFWEFRVNGEASEVGIASYLADEGDQVTFRYNRTTWEQVD